MSWCLASNVIHFWHTQHHGNVNSALSNIIWSMEASSAALTILSHANLDSKLYSEEVCYCSLIPLFFWSYYYHHFQSRTLFLKLLWLFSSCSSLYKNSGCIKPITTCSPSSTRLICRPRPKLPGTSAPPLKCNVGGGRGGGGKLFYSTKNFVRNMDPIRPAVTRFSGVVVW